MSHAFNVFGIIIIILGIIVLVLLVVLSLIGNANASFAENRKTPLPKTV